MPTYRPHKPARNSSKLNLMDLEVSGRHVSAPKKKFYYIGYDYVGRKTCELQTNKRPRAALEAARLINSSTVRLVEVTVNR